MIKVKGNKSIKHVFQITNSKETIHDDIQNLIKFAIKRKKELNVKYFLLERNDIVVFEFDKPTAMKVDSFEINDTYFLKIPYKDIFKSVSYHYIKLNVLNNLDKS